MKNKHDNIAEYVLYLWQIEDYLRAFPQQAEANSELHDLHEMMHREGIAESGHLNLAQNALKEMEQIHAELLEDEAQYRAMVIRIQPALNIFKSKTDRPTMSDIEACLTLLYKTTLGRSILRLADPTSGKVWFDDIEVTALKGQALRDFRKQAQIVFQDPYSSLNPRITIGEAIAEPMRTHGIETDITKLRSAVCDLLEQVGLQAAHYDRYPHEFSGGQRQRICIARALAVKIGRASCRERVSPRV